MYTKAEVLHRKDGFAVQLTWKEPFEDIFCIKIHRARFESLLDAVRLRDRVLDAVRAVYPMSEATAIDLDEWETHSSPYGPTKASSKAPYKVPTSEWAKRKLEIHDL